MWRLSIFGDFEDYYFGKKEFDVPVYAVFGNHEDSEVVQELQRGHQIKNLHLLDENHQYVVNECFQLFGLGGNFLLNKKAYESTFQGVGGKVQCTFHQLGKLMKNVERSSLPAICVSHVSPGKEPLLSRLFAHLAPECWISGHMGAPFPCVWNQETIRRWKEIEVWMGDLPEIESRDNFTKETLYALEKMEAPLENHHDWVRRTWNINLPDFHEGHALLVMDKRKWSLESFGVRNIPKINRL